MATYRVYSEWKHVGWQDIEADSAKDAEEKAQADPGLPPNHQYLDDSFEITGVFKVNEERPNGRWCSECSGLLVKQGGYYQCVECGQLFMSWPKQQHGGES